MRFDAILLDVDGTLVDSNDAHAEAWSLAATRNGFGRDVAFFRPLIGMGGDRVLPAIDPSLTEDSAMGKAIAAERKRLMLEEFTPAVRAMPGARAFVEACKTRGLRCVIATSSTEEELQAMLDRANVADLMDERVTSADIAHAKPAPDVIRTALEKTGLDATRAVLLGDTPYDVESAAKAGVATIALRCGGSPDRELAGAAVIYDDPAQALEHLDEILRGAWTQSP